MTYYHIKNLLFFSNKKQPSFQLRRTLKRRITYFLLSVVHNEHCIHLIVIAPSQSIINKAH